MGLFELVSDYITSFAGVDAEAAAAEDKPEDSGEEESKDEGESEPKEEEEEEAPEEEEEEEEEEEPEDPMPKITEECEKSKACSPHKHHFDECSERVQKKIDEDGKSDEDCVEEFFHLAHCASACAAPKLFKILK